MNMTDPILLEAFRDALNALKPGWSVTRDGIVGPGGAVVRLTQRHEVQSVGHVDVQFILSDASTRPAVLWDCVAGFGATPAERARFAARLWSQTTAGALCELKYSLRGEFADHFRGNEPGGLTEWHVICSPILGFGAGESSCKLQQWWLDNPVLPSLTHALGDSLSEQDCPHGIKILFGGDGDGIAEVRVDGEPHEAASTALAGLAWPRLEPPGFVRSYVIALHRDVGGIPD